MEAIGNAIHQSIRTSIQSALAVGDWNVYCIALKDPIFPEFVPIFSDAKYLFLTASLLYDLFLLVMRWIMLAVRLVLGCGPWKHQTISYRFRIYSLASVSGKQSYNRWRSSPMSRWLRRPPPHRSASILPTICFGHVRPSRFATTTCRYIYKWRRGVKSTSIGHENAFSWNRHRLGASMCGVTGWARCGTFFSPVAPYKDFVFPTTTPKKVARSTNPGGTGVLKM